MATVADLRRWLEGFDPEALVVVPIGPGYESPKLRVGTVRPVLVPDRYVHDDDGQGVIVIGPTHV